MLISGTATVKDELGGMRIFPDKMPLGMLIDLLILRIKGQSRKPIYAGVSDCFTAAADEMFAITAAPTLKYDAFWLVFCSPPRM